MSEPTKAGGHLRAPTNRASHRCAGRSQAVRKSDSCAPRDLLAQGWPTNGAPAYGERNGRRTEQDEEPSPSLAVLPMRSRDVCRDGVRPRLAARFVCEVREHRAGAGPDLWIES